MSTNWRALCQELTHEVEQYAEDRGDLMPECAERARAALAAEPVAEGPTDEELTLTYAYAVAAAVDNRRGPFSKTDAEAAQLSGLRAVLARYGHQPAPAAEGADCPACEGVPKPGNQPCAVCGRSASSAGGEVAELAWWLRSLEDASVWFESGSPEALKLTRAADLLEQRHPEPVPVSERLPGPEDCDAEGRCWLLTVEDEYPQWRLHSIEGNQPGGSTMIWVPVDSSPGVMVDAFYASHWLPASALPLPQGEVEA